MLPRVITEYVRRTIRESMNAGRSQRTGGAPRDLVVYAMDRFGDAVYRTALSHLASTADAEDVFQDVFLRLHRAETAFNDDEHLKAWLLHVTLNRCRDLAREAWRRKRALYDSGSFKAIPDPSPDAAPDGALRRRPHRRSARHRRRRGRRA